MEPKGNHLLSILTSPDGLVLVPSALLAKIHNESEAAALLSFAIAAVSQEQDYQSWSILFSKPAQRKSGFDTAGSLTAFGQWQTEQQYRNGIRQMYLAGYDIREAPFVWAVARGKTSSHPASYTPKDADRDIQWFTDYVRNHISAYYRDVDFSKLKRGEAEYQQFLAELRKADPEAFTDSASQGKQ